MKYVRSSPGIHYTYFLFFILVQLCLKNDTRLCIFKQQEFIETIKTEVTYLGVHDFHYSAESGSPPPLLFTPCSFGLRSVVEVGEWWLRWLATALSPWCVRVSVRALLPSLPPLPPPLPSERFPVDSSHHSVAFPKREGEHAPFVGCASYVQCPYFGNQHSG